MWQTNYVCEMCHERAYNVKKRRRRGEYGRHRASWDEKLIFIMISFGVLWGGTWEESCDKNCLNIKIKFAHKLFSSKFRQLFNLFNALKIDFETLPKMPAKQHRRLHFSGVSSFHLRSVWNTMEVWGVSHHCPLWSTSSGWEWRSRNSFGCLGTETDSKGLCLLKTLQRTLQELFSSPLQ